MVLSSLPRLSASLMGPSLPRQICCAARTMATGPFNDKERAEESIHFRKEDERLLRKLLQKVKAQADTVDVHEAEGAKSVEKSQLKALLGNKVTDADIEALIKWKHDH